MNILSTFFEGFRAISPKDSPSLQAKILALEEKILKEDKKLERKDFETEHFFSHGVYGRVLSLPKGSLIVGAIHKFENMNIILKGTLSFFSKDGIKTVSAPHVYIGSVGAKRVIYAHEDSQWMNCHGTNETDLKKIEEIFIAKNFDEVEAISDEEKTLIKECQKCLGL